MKLDYSQEELLSIIHPLLVEGSTSSQITGISPLDKATTGDLAFLGKRKYKSFVPTCHASIILLPLDYKGQPENDQAYFRVKYPASELAKLCSADGYPWPKPIPGIHPTAIVDPSAEIDPLAFIGPFCTISAGAKIAKNVIIGFGVHIGINVIIHESSVLMPKSRVMDYCILGKRVRLRSGIVIGSDGFGYHFQAGVHKKVPRGIAIVEDDVEIGSYATIDKVPFTQIRIDPETKIDTSVPLPHNVEVGKHCIVISKSKIPRSIMDEDYEDIGGQVAIADYLRIQQDFRKPPLPFIVAQQLKVFKKRLPQLLKRVSKRKKTLAIHEFQ